VGVRFYDFAELEQQEDEQHERQLSVFRWQENRNQAEDGWRTIETTNM